MSNFTSFFRTSACLLALAGAFSSFAEEKELDIQISDVSYRDAFMTLTNTPYDLTYYWNFDTKVNFEAAGGADKAIDNAIVKIKQTADRYGYSDWLDFLQYQIYYEPQYENLGDWADMLYDEDYVVYAFGIDYDGNVTTSLVTKEFHTLAPATSDMTFDVTVPEIENKGSYYTATAMVNPSAEGNYTMKYFAKETLDEFDLTPGSYGEKSFLCDYVIRYLRQEAIYSGPGELSMTNLNEGKEYAVAVVGLDNNNLPATPLSVTYFKTSENGNNDDPGHEDEKGSIDISVSDVTYNDAYMQLIPTPDDLRFYWNFTTKTEFENNGGVDKIVESCIAKWEKDAATYQEPDWQSMLPYVLFEGAQYEDLGSWKDMLYDEDYVVYAFGMDMDGNLIVPVTTAEFHTLGVATSDNTFDVTVTSVEENGVYLTATAHIVPSNSDTYMARIYPKSTLDRFDITSGSFNEKKFSCEEMLYSLKDSEIKTGESDVTNERCVEDQEYAVVVMGLDANKMPSTGLTIAYFTAVVEKPELGTITLEVEDITPMNARIKITPSSNEYRYFYDITTPDIIEAKGGVENIPERLIIDWWKFLADIYQLDDWRECIEWQTTTGNIDSTVAELVEEGEISDIYWDRDYVLYAVGFNENGDVMTEPAVLYFSTPPVEEQSDMTFKFQIINSELDPAYPNTGNIKYYKVTIEVDPSNDDDNYLFKTSQTKYYDQYLEDDEPDWFDFITRQFLPYSMEVSGLAHFQCPGIQGTDYDGNDLNYYAITMGWNEGPTTDLFLFKYNPVQEAAKSILNSVANEGVKVMVENGKIYLLGDFENAVVYSTDGRVIAACRPGIKVAVPAGIYVVKYNDINGVAVTKKVLVK
ncbi:MAG: hypothetical protein K2N05_03145 [Muribaculaceae bacterium]|nr:hypothetical protein [Muribaculaceae bacterium]